MSLSSDVFWLLTEPFDEAPDARFLLQTPPVRRATFALARALDGGAGIAVLTGDEGVGKSTVARLFADGDTAGPRVVLVVDGSAPWDELRSELAERLSAREQSGAALARSRTVVMIDGAEAMSEATVRELEASFLEASQERIRAGLLGLVLVVRKGSDSDVLDWAAARGAAIVELAPLTAAETGDYIERRIELAAGGERALFDPGALDEVHRRTGGRPGAINRVCAAALERVAERNAPCATASDVREAAESLGDLPAVVARALDDVDEVEASAADLELPPVPVADRLEIHQIARTLTTGPDEAPAPPALGPAPDASDAPNPWAAARRGHSASVVALAATLGAVGGAALVLGAAWLYLGDGRLGRSEEPLPSVSTGPPREPVVAPAPSVVSKIAPAAEQPTDGTGPATRPARPPAPDATGARSPALAPPLRAEREPAAGSRDAPSKDAPRAAREPAATAVDASALDAATRTPEAEPASLARAALPDAAPREAPIAATPPADEASGPASERARPAPNPSLPAVSAPPPDRLRVPPLASGAPRVPLPLGEAAPILDRALAALTGPGQFWSVQLFRVTADGRRPLDALELAHASIDGRTRTIALLAGQGERPAARVLGVSGNDDDAGATSYWPEENASRALASGSAGSDPFHGTGFRYDDFRPERASAYVIERLEGDTRDGEPVFVVTARRADGAPVEIWIRERDEVVVERRELASDGNELSRRLVMQDAAESPDGSAPLRWIVLGPDGRRVAEADIWRALLSERASPGLFTLAALRADDLVIPLR